MAWLYDQLALAYLRLGRNKEAYTAASYARFLAPSQAGAYIVMGEDLVSENRKEEAAITLMAGFLATADQKFIPLLQNVYEGGLDPQGCLFAPTSNGLILNNSCEIAHKDICKAFAEIIGVSLQANQRDFVKSVRQNASGHMGCTEDELR